MKRYFPPSELLIEENGAIYHLGVKPEQLADKVILVGDPNRVPKVAAFFDKQECDISAREFRTITGSYQGKRITVVGTGIGCDNIDIVMNELDALANIDFDTRQEKEKFTQLQVVRIGTCGGLQEFTPTGSVICSAKSIGFDGLLNFYEGRNEVCDLPFETAFMQHMNWSPQLAAPYTIDADAELTQRIAQDDMIRGVTISCGGFFGPQGRRLRVPLAFPKQNELVESFEHKLRDGKLRRGRSLATHGTQSNHSLPGHSKPKSPERRHRLQQKHEHPHKDSTRPHLITTNP